MAETKQETFAPTRSGRDPFALLRRITSELDRVFDEWPPFGFSSVRHGTPEFTGWSPKIDVFERDNRLVIRADLPGMKKEDVSVEVSDGFLALSGERKQEKEDKHDNFYRVEREYGRFYRAIPLPDGVKLEDIKATFSDGVLEVGAPIPSRPKANERRIEIEEPKKAVKNVAA
jgi:HSP20 family protein